MSKILAVPCIWKVTSKPLIWPLFESDLVDMTLIHGIFKLFSIFFNFLLPCVSQAVSFQPLDRIQFSIARFFRFVFWICRVKKKIGPFCLFGPFWAIFSILSFFFLIFDLFFFQMFNDVKNFSYTMHSKGDVKTFNLTTFWI